MGSVNNDKPVQNSTEKSNSNKNGSPNEESKELTPQSPSEKIGFLFERGPEDIFSSPLSEFSEFLLDSGTLPEHLPVALITLITMNSAHLDNPLVLVLTEDDGADSLDLLNKCASLTPDDSILEFSTIPNDISLGGKQLKGKSIIIFDAMGAQKKGLLKIVQLLERGLVVDQQAIRRKNNTGFKETSAEGPTGLVTIAKSLDDPFLQLPSILKFHLPMDQYLKRKKLSIKGQSAYYATHRDAILLSSMIKKLFEKLQTKSVTIPYREQLLDAIDFTIQDIGNQFELFEKLLKIITIINNYTPVSGRELMEEFLGISHQNLLPAKIQQQATENTSPLIATKRDYYFTWLLMNGITIGRGDVLDSRKRHIFDAIMKYHMEYAKVLSIKEGPDYERKVLETLDHSSHLGAWPSVEQITTAAIKDGGEQFSPGTCRNELEELVKREIIIKQHISKKPAKYGYRATVLSEQRLRLPHPSDIDDPIYNKKSVEVVNPLTGEVDTI